MKNGHPYFPRASLRPLEPTPSSPVRMSTVEIAALTGKRHFHVLRDARLMLAELAGDNPDPNLDAGRFDGKYADEQGQERPCLMLPWRETMILVTGYSVPMRARVIDRWAELEAAEAARAALPVEPPQELFPPNALERLTGTAIENVKRWEKARARRVLWIGITRPDSGAGL